MVAEKSQKAQALEPEHMVTPSSVVQHKWYRKLCTYITWAFKKQFQKTSNHSSNTPPTTDNILATTPLWASATVIFAFVANTKPPTKSTLMQISASGVPPNACARLDQAKSYRWWEVLLVAEARTWACTWMSKGQSQHQTSRSNTKTWADLGPLDKGGKQLCQEPFKPWFEISLEKSFSL